MAGQPPGKVISPLRPSPDPRKRWEMDKQRAACAQGHHPPLGVSDLIRVSLGDRTAQREGCCQDDRCGTAGRAQPGLQPDTPLAG